MIKLLDILENKILVPRRSKEERAKNYQIIIQKKIQQYTCFLMGIEINLHLEVERN